MSQTRPLPRAIARRARAGHAASLTRRIAWALTLAWACGGALHAATPPPAAPPIFRYVSLGGSGTILLGAPPSAAFMDVAPPYPAGRYAVANGHFGGAERIDLDTNADGLVETVYFRYAHDTVYASKLAFYTHLLGTPTSQRAGETAFARWDDADTTFELRREPGAVIAILVDRRLGRK